MQRGTPQALESVRLAFDTSYFLWYVFAAKTGGSVHGGPHDNAPSGLAQSPEVADRVRLRRRTDAAVHDSWTFKWLLLVFPLWVLVVSIWILRTARTR